MPELIEDATNELPGSFRLLVQRLVDQLKELDRQVSEIEAQVVAWHRDNDVSSKLAKIPGVGPITASALVATVGDAKNFSNGRQLAAWLGLVPKQNSSGGRNVLLGISKRGDTYLRTLLIHGARAVINAAQRKNAQIDGWLGGVLQRRNKNVVAVALANKNARIVWALLRHDRSFKAELGRSMTRTPRRSRSCIANSRPQAWRVPSSPVRRSTVPCFPATSQLSGCRSQYTARCAIW